MSAALLWWQSWRVRPTSHGLQSLEYLLSGLLEKSRLEVRKAWCLQWCCDRQIWVRPKVRAIIEVIVGPRRLDQRGSVKEVIISMKRESGWRSKRSPHIQDRKGKCLVTIKKKGRLEEEKHCQTMEWPGVLSSWKSYYISPLEGNWWLQ